MARWWATAQLSAITFALLSMRVTVFGELTHEADSNTKFTVRDGACSVSSSTCSRTDAEQQEQNEYTAMSVELAQMRMSKNKKQMPVYDKEEDTTGVVSKLPSEWPDKPQLTALYHELMLDDAWIPPQQKQLSQVQKQCMEKAMAENNKIKGYEKWHPGEPWRKTYRQYTGGPSEWTTGALATLSELYVRGLEETSMVLDIGCGALRLGRLLIPLLARGHYHCVDPGRELIQDGIKFELGYDLLQRKLPSFAVNEEFRAPPGLPESLVGSDANATAERPTYDFILARSIFTHTADDLFHLAMTNLKPHFNSNTRMLATFMIAANHCKYVLSDSTSISGWVYGEEDEPLFVCHNPEHLTKLLKSHGLTWDYSSPTFGSNDSGQELVVIYLQD